MRLSATNLAAERGGRTVFDDVSFALASGEMLAVTGPNGVGKSTLLRLVAGLLRPVGGTITAEPDPDAGIGSQAHYLGHLDGLKRALTIRENLEFWRRIWGGDRDSEDAIAAVGLDDLGTLPVATLSAGQQRRVAIARMLMAHRPIWLLDEPATALDARAEVTLGRLIEHHLAKGGLIIAATHRGLPVTPTETLALGPAA